MCGWCCGSTPIEQRGEGHKGCSPTCHNAGPRQRSEVRALARAEVLTWIRDGAAPAEHASYFRALQDAIATRPTTPVRTTE